MFDAEKNILDESSENQLAELAEEFVSRLRRGERPGVTEYCARHPELAADIRDLFPTLGVMEGVRHDSNRNRCDASQSEHLVLGWRV